MRNYAIHQSNSFSGQNSGLLANLLRNWRARRAVSQLESFDDNLLRDIGVERAEVAWAANLPLRINAAIALEERASQRRRKFVPIS
jgi:uncharacterized protein YjiS (DUF1127 family)